MQNQWEFFFINHIICVTLQQSNLEWDISTHWRNALHLSVCSYVFIAFWRRVAVVLKQVSPGTCDRAESDNLVRLLCPKAVAAVSLPCTQPVFPSRNFPQMLLWLLLVLSACSVKNSFHLEEVLVLLCAKRGSWGVWRDKTTQKLLKDWPRHMAEKWRSLTRSQILGILSNLRYQVPDFLLYACSRK